MVRLVLILSIIQHFLDRRDQRCFICYPISIKDLFKRQYVKCLRELFGLIITHSVYSSLDYDMVNSFHEQCNAGQYVFPLISCLGYTLEKIFFFVYFCLRLSMSKILDAIQKLLLLCGQLHQELGPSPIGVQKVGRRTGEDQQLRWKRVCTEAGSQPCAITETSLDRAKVESKRQQVPLVRQLSTILQFLGSGWTEWKILGAMRQHVDCALNLPALPSFWLLEWYFLQNPLAISLWLCLQEDVMVTVAQD